MSYQSGGDKNEPAHIAAARHLLAINDDFMAGKDVDADAAKRLGLASAFGAQAFTVCPQLNARPSAMLRALLLAIIDPTHPDLDYLRAINKVRAVPSLPKAP